MPNRSHFNNGHRTLNGLNKNGVKHSAVIADKKVERTMHALFVEDAISFLRKIPDNSIQLILIDPPYNLDIDIWDRFNNYLDWAKQWIDEVFRILSETGSCVIFGGFQYQDLKKGDLLEILYYTRHSTKLRFINLIIWYYKNGMSAHRFFANRHEEAIWLSKTNKYYFNLEAVRVPFDEKTRELYKKDKRLNPLSIDKGKNPTNVWEIGRLNGNSNERVGHLTQKPAEIIRRFVKALSYKGAIVLDFFAGSGTTGRVCIEEQRHSILVDSDKNLIGYFDKHIKQISSNICLPQYKIIKNNELSLFFNEVNFANSD